MSDKYGQQQTMFETEGPATRDSGPVTCLGMTFENDEARRATLELRKNCRPGVSQDRRLSHRQRRRHPEPERSAVLPPARTRG